MATKGFMGEIHFIEQELDGNVYLYFKAYYLGPEIAAWSQNYWKTWEVDCKMLVTGTESVQEINNKIVQTMIDGMIGTTGIVVAPADIYYTQYTKGN